MRKTLAGALALCLSFAPGIVFALGLGNIEVSSYLNEPLEAKVPLVSVTSAELNTINVGLAPADTFEAAGLQRTPILRELEFEVIRQGASSYIRITSNQVVRDPFLSFLVEVNWAQGRLVREYTILLDPPVLIDRAPTTPQQPTVAPVPAPQVQEPQTPVSSPELVVPEPVQEVSEPPAAAESVATETPIPEPVPIEEGMVGDLDDESDYGPVVRGENLWTIAKDMRGGEAISINQMMIAIFERNPDAFQGNINRLKAGAVLRIPSREEIRRISRREAFQEAKRQNEQWAEWKQSRLASAPTPPAPAPAAISETEPVREEPEQEPAGDEPVIAEAEATPTTPRLQLVPPDEPVGLEEEASAAESTELAMVEDEPADGVSAAGDGAAAPAEETAGLLKLGDSELAGMQSELGEMVETEETADAGLSETGEAVSKESEAADSMMEGPESVQPEPVAPAAQPETKPVREPAPATQQPLVDRILSFIQQPFVLGGVLLVLLVLYLLLRRRGRGEEELPEDSEIPQSTDETLIDDDEDTVVYGDSEYQSEADSPVVDEPTEALEGAPGAVIEDDAEAASLGVDAEDPLAEAEFNISYGLYDEALEVVEKALVRYPDRRDLKLKRLEIYFAASDRDNFLKFANELAETPPGKADSAWERAAIMGQQMFPDESLFVEDGAPSDAADSDFLDLDLGTESELGDENETESKGSGAFSAFSGAADASEDEGLDFNVETGSSWTEGDEAKTSVAGEVAESDATEILSRSTGADESGEDYGFDLDQDEEAFSDEDAPLAAEGEDEVETKLDLGKAYIGMGEIDDARRVLSEVLTEGNESQRKEAQTLLDQMDIPVVEGADADDTSSDEPLTMDAVDEPVGDVLEDDEDLGTKDDVGTKLDLARAYLDMDDAEGARALITEVIEEGTPEQRKEAEALLAELP